MYEGSPTIITALLTTVPKIGVFFNFSSNSPVIFPSLVPLLMVNANFLVKI